jgi:hypothetical protein
VERDRLAGVVACEQVRTLDTSAAQVEAQRAREFARRGRAEDCALATRLRVHCGEQRSASRAPFLPTLRVLGHGLARAVLDGEARSRRR